MVAIHEGNEEVARKECKRNDEFIMNFFDNGNFSE
jgi:hypothetical protein